MKSIFVIGPSGSGKSTLSQYLNEIYKCLFGANSTLLINLDPANPSQQQSSYDIDLNNLVSIQDIMEEFEIGPNGAMIYAMDFLFQNKSWLSQNIRTILQTKQPHLKLQKTLNSNSPTPSQSTDPFYMIFDLPGQIQLYLQNDSSKRLIQYVQQSFTPQSIILELFDSTYIYQVNDFVALSMMSLVTMINLQMPQINVLNKVDVIKGQRPSLGILNQYFDTYSMKGIVDDLTLSEQSETNKILFSISQILDQFNQVSFLPCSIYHLSLIKFLLLQIQQCFNSHQTNKLTNLNYAKFIKQVDRLMAKQELITQLENQLFKQEEQQQEQEKKLINKVLEDIKKEVLKCDIK